MRYDKLKSIKKLYFGCDDLARSLEISRASAIVSANRYAAQGLIVRIKKNVYVLKERWDALTGEEVFSLANLIQVPSYISLMTALGYYDVTTQMQRDFIESLALKRTKEVKAGDKVFNFTRLGRKLYFGFSRIKGFFIASPEKAFLDAIYLKSFGRYKFDMTSIDFDKLDKIKINRMAKLFPERTKRMLKNYGYSAKT